jgi:hypothetical protein
VRWQQKESHQEADRFEPRLERAVAKVFERLADEIEIEFLAVVIGTGNAKAALRMLDQLRIDEQFAAPAAIISDVVIKGGKVAERILE